MLTRNIQLDAQGRLRHFLSIEGLKRALLVEILDLAESFAGVAEQTVKKVPLLRGKTIVNLFFESSTRTRTTFELAAKRLSADVLNLNISVSATNKGERCSTRYTISRPCTPICSWYDTLTLVRRTSSPPMSRPMCMWSMPETGAMPIPPRPC